MTPNRETLCESGIANSSARPPPRNYLLQVTSGPSRHIPVALGGRPVVVGAGPTCDMILDDPRVSRRHAEIRAGLEGIQISDLGSTNGVWVDGVRIKEATAPINALIRVGDTTLRIVRTSAPKISPSMRVRFGGLVGESAVMREVFAVLELAAPTDAVVLIQGESGTGKELAARAIHDHSPRAHRPFVVLDCSTTNEQLIESQLFGHRVGAFTGAVAHRDGAFLEASGGTIFLDEIGELPLPSQAKLLRVLDQRTVTPVGTDRPVPIDVRVIAATHRDLAAMVDAKQFRFDLFHRLSVVHLALPPLRERFEDLPCLVRYFYEGRGHDPGPIEGANLELLGSHRWPGNVREMRNVLDRAWVISGANDTRFADLPIWLGAESTPCLEVVDGTLPFKEAKRRWVEIFERRYLTAVFTRFGGNIARTSAFAGINRRHLRGLLDAYNLRERDSSDAAEPDDE
jgi:DNA-binding NtrC family response regulator